MAERPSVPRDQLVAWLDTLLESAGCRDYGPNGLQVEGRAEVAHVVTGVSACVELFRAARTRGADTVLVHHGIFWDGAPVALVGHPARARPRAPARRPQPRRLPPAARPPRRGRQQRPRRARPRAAGAAALRGAQRHGDRLSAASSPSPCPSPSSWRRCRDLFGQEPLRSGAGPAAVRTVGIVSGGAQEELHQAIAAGLDLYITGESSEWVMTVASECGI